MTYDWLESEENYLVYIGDTMCSWCYGFAPELDKIVKSHPDIQLKVINGGLRPKNTQKISDMADFIQGHWDEVSKRSGQPFAYDILKSEDFIYDTEPASRAVIVARMMNPAIEYDFFKAVQTAFYAQNKDTNKIETFLKIAEEFDLDLEFFEKLYNSDDSKSLTVADFQLSAKLGIKGFPALVLKLNGEYIQIGNGYREAEFIENIIEEVFASRNNN